MPRLVSAAYQKRVMAARDRLHALDPHLADLLDSTAYDTLHRAIVRAPGHDGEPQNGVTEIITGDIPAMWIRDAVVQVEPLWAVYRECGVVRCLLDGLLRRLSAAILKTPYANAVIVKPDEATRDRLRALGVPESWLDGQTPHAGDILPDVIEREGAWEVKWEADSLAWYLRLVRRWLDQRLGSAAAGGARVNEKRQHERFQDVFEDLVGPAMDGVLTMLGNEMGLLYGSLYKFKRPGGGPLDHGPGPAFTNNHAVTLVRSAFRPSDDRCVHPYHIPTNAMLAVELEKVGLLLTRRLPLLKIKTMVENLNPLASSGWLELESPQLEELGAMCLCLSELIRETFDMLFSSTLDDLQPTPEALVQFGKLPYEWDGDRQQHYGDDANVPGLHSLRWLGMPETEPMQTPFAEKLWSDSLGRKWSELNSRLLVDQTTRFVYSAANPQFVALPAAVRAKCGVAGGLGSEHTGPGMLWPMSLAVAALGEGNPVKKLGWLRALGEMCPDGQVHEAVRPENPAEYTREWFGMGNALGALALMEWAGDRKDEG